MEVNYIITELLYIAIKVKHTLMPGAARLSSVTGWDVMLLALTCHGYSIVFESDTVDMNV